MLLFEKKEKTDIKELLKYRPKSCVKEDFESWRQKQKNKVCVYVCYVGIYDNEHLFKYGQTIDLYDRMGKHKTYFLKAKQSNPYATFSPIHYRESNKRNSVEYEFKVQMEKLRLHRKPQINGNNHIEFFTITKKFKLQDILNIFDNIASQYPAASNITETGERYRIHSQKSKPKLYVNTGGRSNKHYADVLDFINQYDKFTAESLQVQFDYVINVTNELQNVAQLLNKKFNYLKIFNKLLSKELNIKIKGTPIDFDFIENYQNFLTLIYDFNKYLNAEIDFSVLSPWLQVHKKLYDSNTLDSAKRYLFDILNKVSNI